MRPYHPANLTYQPYAPWRVIALAWIGSLLGVQFKINGIPYGAPKDKALWLRHERKVTGFYDNSDASPSTRIPPHRG